MKTYNFEQVLPFVIERGQTPSDYDMELAKKYADILNFIDDANKPMSLSDLGEHFTGHKYSLGFIYCYVCKMMDHSFIAHDDKVGWDSKGNWAVLPVSKWRDALETFVFRENRRLENRRPTHTERKVQ